MMIFLQEDMGVNLCGLGFGYEFWHRTLQLYTFIIKKIVKLDLIKIKTSAPQVTLLRKWKLQS
jgi:hypothetical protein